MGGFLVPVITIIIAILNIYWWVIIISAVVSWLTAFGVINTYNRSVAMALDVLYRLTEPVYRPIRQFLPNLGGLDLSPLVVLLIIWFAEMELAHLANYLYQI
jgi:YggT family protein